MQSEAGPLLPVRGTVVITHIGIGAGVPPHLVKLRRHGSQETNVFREGITEAIEEVFFCHQYDQRRQRLPVGAPTQWSRSRRTPRG